MQIVYSPSEINEFKNAIGKYVLVNGVVYSVTEKMSLEDGTKEQERRSTLPRDNYELSQYHVITCDDCMYMCSRQYCNSL